MNCFYTLGLADNIATMATPPLKNSVISEASAARFKKNSVEQGAFYLVKNSLT